MFDQKNKNILGIETKQTFSFTRKLKRFRRDIFLNIWSINLKCYVFQLELCDVKAILYMTCLFWGYSALVKYSIPTVTVFHKLFKLDNFWKSYNKPIKYCSRYQDCNISSILSPSLYCRMIIISCIELAVHWSVV